MLLIFLSTVIPFMLPISYIFFLQFVTFIGLYYWFWTRKKISGPQNKHTYSLQVYFVLFNLLSLIVILHVGCVINVFDLITYLFDKMISYWLSLIINDEGINLSFKGCYSALNKKPVFSMVSCLLSGIVSFLFQHF